MKQANLNMLERLEELKEGERTPAWYNADIAIREIVRRMHLLEYQIALLESKYDDNRN